MATAKKSSTGAKLSPAARILAALELARSSNLAAKFKAALAEDPGLLKLLSKVTLADVLTPPAAKPGRSARAPKSTEPAPSSAKPVPTDKQLLAAVAAVGKQADAQRDAAGTVWVRATKVAEHLGLDTSVVRKGLGALVKAGKLDSTGKAAGTRYALVK